MAIDWETVRRNRLRDEEPIRLSDDEAAWLEERRRDEAARRERERHEAGVKAARADFESKAAQARKSGDEERAGVFAWAAGEIEKGNWPVHRLIASDPGITRHQATRTKLLYEGKTAQLREQSAYSTYMKEHEGA